MYYLVTVLNNCNNCNERDALKIKIEKILRLYSMPSSITQINLQACIVDNEQGFIIII